MSGAITELVSESPTVSLTGGFHSIIDMAPFGTAATNLPTLGLLQTGSMAIKWVALIEGCEIVLSDATQSAVQAALAGTDWASASVLSGLFVELRNEQSIDPTKPFATGGRLVLRALDTDGADSFGTLVHKRLAGGETELTATVDRNDTTINVKSTTGFTSSGTIHLGTEAISYTGTTATSFTGCTRGLYSPFDCDSSGSGTRFANHHRWGKDNRYIQAQPVVTQLPRVWIGKRVALYLHTWDGESLNTRSAAQLVYAGRIVGIADDPGSFTTVLDVEHMSKEWEEGIIGKDLFQAEIPPGMWLAAGRKFIFRDSKDGTLVVANDLNVVASGASGTNQINEGFYSLGEICSALNSWLAGELTAARIYGSYSWSSPVAYRSDGLRTVCQWAIADAGVKKVGWHFEAPTEILAFLGLVDIEPAQNGAMGAFVSNGTYYSNTSYSKPGAAVPYASVVFRPYGPARLGQEYSDEIIYDLENIRGVFSDQRALMPAAIKDNIATDQVGGLFLLDEKTLMVGVYDSTNFRFKNCWLAPYRQQSEDSQEAMTYVGKRADEPQSAIPVRQVFMLDGSLDTILKSLVYSTGTTGFNHGTYDTLGSGLGLGIPGSLLGPEFDRSVSNLPKVDYPIVVVIDEPTRFSELMSADLLIRRSFVRWRDQGFELGTWKTPTAAMAVATLNESNKAEPSGNKTDHRTASLETDVYQRTSVKIDYERDFASGRDGKYLKSVQIEDQGATDQTDGATGSRVLTLKMRNTYSDIANTGAGVEALIPGYMATMPMFSRPAHQVSRSIDIRFFEGFAVGDVVEYTDSYARDPITGRRGTASRPAVITRLWCDYGGPDSGGGTPRQMAGGVELMFLDLHRGCIYSPSADVDNEATFGGFDKGYKDLPLVSAGVLRCKGHSYSRSVSLPTRRGFVVTVSEQLDASNFQAGDEIVIVELDPATPASPTTWVRTVNSVSGNDITLTTALSSPAWDNTKRYMVVSALYTSAQLTQQDDAYQADDTDLLIQDTDPACHYAASQEEHDYVENP